MIRINTHSRHTGRLEWDSLEDLRAEMWPPTVYRPDYDNVADYVAALLEIPRQNVVQADEPPSLFDVHVFEFEYGQALAGDVARIYG